MAKTESASRVGTLMGWAWFLSWAAVGGLYSVAFVGALSIGVFVLAVAVVLTVLLARYQPFPRATIGVICGLGVPPLYVAYLNRSYGGPACATRGTVTSHQLGVVHECVQRLDPLPWSIAGTLLVAGGCVAFIVGQRARSAAGVPNRATRHDR